MKPEDHKLKYHIILEPAMLHYKFLYSQQLSLVGSMLGDIYLICTTEDSNIAPHIECWEFLMILEHLEPETFERQEFKELFYKYADLIVEGTTGQMMSLTRFCKLCLMRNLLSMESRKAYFKKHRISNMFDFEDFSKQFHSCYMVTSIYCSNVCLRLFTSWSRTKSTRRD